jgi:hypothetical protein
VTGAPAGPGVTWIAGELLEEGLCSARCLLALSDGPCECACSGRWHGVLAGAQVTEGTPRPATRAIPRGRPAPGEWVREFSHPHIAALPSYATLRQALSDVGNEVDEQQLGDWPEWLGAIRDMTLTAPFGDSCERCETACSEDHDQDCTCGFTALSWPHAVERDDGWMTAHYRCAHDHRWTCGWAPGHWGLR